MGKGNDAESDMTDSEEEAMAKAAAALRYYGPRTSCSLAERIGEDEATVGEWLRIMSRAPYRFVRKDGDLWSYVEPSVFRKALWAVGQ